MDCISSYSKISLPKFPPHQLKNTLSISTPSSIIFSPLQSTLFKLKSKKTLAIVASTNTNNNNNSSSNSSSVDCQFSGLTAPLVPRTPVGKLLSSTLQNEIEWFHEVVEQELMKMSYIRDDTINRMNLSLCSDEAILHRRISELRELECRNAVEEVMYMLIVYKFSKIGVHLVPKLSKCMYNGRLEIWPCKDWELESIHSSGILEIVKFHLSAIVGWEDKLNVKDKWALTQAELLHIRVVYAASIRFGYFLKSASLRYDLEQSFDHINSDLGSITTSSNLLFSRSWPSKQKSVLFGRVSDAGSTSGGPVSVIEQEKQENLMSYVMSLDHETVQMCTKPKFKETMNLIEKQCAALFGDDCDEVVLTSLASMKRFVLEAVAFGSFLWDAEDYVRAFYRLEEN
ncbi:UV-B-induced protein At3g17800, chloroplastic-like [Lycium ferocissimum]|uniref:UV-B-induced protein At3g17800, chloroplastic-like n=1 Tax=Lycium ferocissimum TaxID=112874 RepID=UPI002815D14C|nr:UV-B-induced protein At3g17800, chloroplastic-like [Lycium ferocissimum]